MIKAGNKKVKLDRFKCTPDEIKSLINTLQPKDSINPDVLSHFNLKRMAISASIIPKAQTRNAKIVDIGGTAYWFPIYTQLLGYKYIISLGRTNYDLSHKFRIHDENSDFIICSLNTDAELDHYPIDSDSVDCVVCFHLLEHLAKDPMHLISEGNRILKNQSSFCLTTPNVLYYVNLARYLFGFHPFGWSVYTNSYADRHNREYTPFEIEKMFESGGFTIELLTTKTHKAVSWKFKIPGYSFSLPAALLNKVGYHLRGQEILVRARKIDNVINRYPEFLYSFYEETGKLKEERI